MKVLKRVLTMTIVVLVLSVLAVMPAMAAPVTTGAETGSISVTNAVSGDAFAAYKIIDATYDPDTNNLTLAFNPNFASFFSSKNMTLAQYAELNQTALHELIADLDAWIDAQAPSSSATATANSSGVAAFSNLAMGQYYIKTTASTSIYSVMVRNLYPVVEDGSYVLNNDTIAAKKQEVDIVKTVANQTENGFSYYDTINYEIVTDVPAYPVGAIDTHYAVGDTMDSGLTYLGNLKVYGVNGSVETELPATAWHFDTTKGEPVAKTAGETFELLFDYNAIKNYANIKITYDAQINENAVIAGLGNDNTATLTYSNWPYSEGNYKTKEDEQTVYTYGIYVFKFDNVTKTPLHGAEFQIYKNSVAEENLITTIATDTDGYASVKDLAAGTYYIVESKAPTGYTLLTEPAVITFTKDQVDAEGTYAGYYKNEIANVAGSTLPETGGMGTIIFVVAGTLLIAAAVTLIVVKAKKSRA